MSALKCPYYRLNSTSKGGGDFNTIPEGRNYGDYLYWDGSQWMVGSNTIHLGANAGKPVQGAYAIALGQEAGTRGQQSHGIAIGYNAGSQTQQPNAIAIGQEAGYQTQSQNAIAIGQFSGYDNQGQYSIAIGQYAGYTAQKQDAISLGRNAGSIAQSTNAIAIGLDAGYQTQGENAVAIGQNVGKNTQGQNAIAIGQNAGETGQSANSIILNASSTSLNAPNTGLFINPIRGPFATSNVLSYNLTTHEIVYNGSSKRYKYDIKDLNENTENLYKLVPREFKYILNDEKDVGLIAEEAQSCDPLFAYTDPDGNPEGIQWNTITTYLIAEMKKLKEDMVLFEKEIESIKYNKNNTQK
jgi:hypothetical protein